MIKVNFLLLFALSISGCASISELPQSASDVNFDSIEAGKIGAFTYADNMIFSDIDKRTAFLAAKEGLMSSDFVLKKTNFHNGTLFGYHDITPHDWNIVAGVYLKEIGSDIAVKVIVQTSKDFSLVGNLGDTTSGSWPQAILSGMQDYIQRESNITNPSKKHFR